MAEKPAGSGLSGVLKSAFDESKSRPVAELTALDHERQADKEEVHKALKKARRDSSSDIPAFDPVKDATVADMLADTELKKLYARRFIWILVGQLLAMNAIFIAVGLEMLKYSDFVINLFMGGTLAEVFGVVLVITKYLFSRK